MRDVTHDEARFSFYRLKKKLLSIVTKFRLQSPGPEIMEKRREKKREKVADESESVKIGYLALTFASRKKVIAPHEGEIRNHH